MDRLNGVRLALAVVVASALSPTVPAVAQRPRPGWKLVWHDEFSGPALDTTKWVRETGGDGWGNAELEFYTDRRENARIEGGHLVIEARRERHDNRDLTSARLKTQGKGAWRYGRMEARIQIPRGQGLWPAFWMLGDNCAAVGWPDCGEIDIMENIGREPNRVHGTVHGPGYSGAQGVSSAHDRRAGAFADDFHVYAIEWEADAIRWYVDDVLYRTIGPKDLPGRWVYDHPFFIILNVAVGGNWPGGPDESTVFPQTMRVDYVRVYEKASDGARRPDAAAQVWLTTGDRSKLLSREADVSFTPNPASGIATIEVDEGTTYQEIVGFGAAITDASAWLIQNRMTPSQREALLQELFGRNTGIGLSFTRLTMGASDFSLRHYSYDDVPPGETDPTLARFSIEPNRADVLPVVKRALAINPQLKIMASPWSAPGWMKTTGSLIQGTLRPEAYGPFAEYFRRYIEAFGAAGVPIYAISVQNEPHYEPADYPGMRLEPPARARFIGEYLGPLFARHGLRTIILDWDHNWDESQSPLGVLADSVASHYVAGVAWHCYGGDVSSQTLVHDAHPDKDAYFTECSGGEWAPNFGDNLKWFVRTLIIGATRGWAKGVLLWNLALDEQHGPHTGGCGDCRGVVTITASSGAAARNVEYYALAHGSRFVRPGARRIESTSGIEGLESVAFRNADDGSKALIVVNTVVQERPFALRWAGQSLRYTLPAGAVVTFSWR